MSPNPQTQSAFSDEDEPRYSIGDLADEFNISTRTIRFYESRGLLSPSRAGINRVYAKRDRARLILILRAKNLGFSLEDIAHYLSLYDADPHHLAQSRFLLDKLDAAINELQQKRVNLDRTMRELKDIRAKCVDRLRKPKRGGDAA